MAGEVEDNSARAAGAVSALPADGTAALAKVEARPFVFSGASMPTIC